MRPTRWPLSVCLLLILLPGASRSQSIFNNPITGTNPSTSSPYTTGQTVAANLTVSGIGRAGVTVATANDRYNASNWTTSSSLDANKYFTWTLTPANGYAINLSSFAYTGQASGTGPTALAFRSNQDSFASNIGSPSISGTTIDLSAATYQNVTSAIEFRLYAFSASATGGTFSVNDFTFSGTVTPVSEPATLLAVTAAGLGLARLRRRLV